MSTTSLYVAIDNELSRPFEERDWGGLVELLEATPEEELARVARYTGQALDDAYETVASRPPEAQRVWFEEDERIAPLAWCIPTPSPLLEVARTIVLDLLDPQLLHLELSNPHELLALARAEATRPITALRLRNAPLKKSLSHMLKGPLFDGLTYLSLAGSDINNAQGARRLAKARPLEGLTALDLSFCHIGREGLEALLSSKILTRLTDLDLSTNCIAGEDMEDVVWWDGVLDRLEERDLLITFL